MPSRPPRTALRTLLPTAAAAALLLAIAAPLAAAPRVVFRPDARPPARDVTRAVQASAVAADQLVLPYFLLDTENLAGIRTFLSVRNNHPSLDFTVEVALGTPEDVVLAYFDLEPLELQTVNLQAFADELAPAGSDVALGWGVVTNVDPVSLEPLPAPPSVLHGDFFVMDPANAFASGDLMPAGDSACSIWGTRFFNGGGFSGGTTIVLTVPGEHSPAVPVATGYVYNEAGNFHGTYDVYDADEVILLDSLSSFDPPLPVAFGVIEWDLVDPGWANVTFDALGQFSVGTSAFCVD